jgi:hypothetical protein
VRKPGESEAAAGRCADSPPLRGSHSSVIAP